MRTLPLQDLMYSRFAAYLEGGVEGFDAAAFRLPRPEAVPLDPQARLLLEHSWVRPLPVLNAACWASMAVAPSSLVAIACVAGSSGKLFSCGCEPPLLAAADMPQAEIGWQAAPRALPSESSLRTSFATTRTGGSVVRWTAAQRPADDRPPCPCRSDRRLRGLHVGRRVSRGASLPSSGQRQPM